MCNILNMFCLLFFQDVDDFFESEKLFLIDYHAKIRDATLKGDRMTKNRKSMFLSMLCLIVSPF